MAEKTKEKEPQTITKDDVGSLEDVLGKNKTLPELIGGFVTRIMEDPKLTQECSRELQMWHDSLPVENRSQLVKDNKKQIETAKLTAEWLFSQYQMISQKDV